MQELFRRDVLITLVHHLRVTSWIEGAERIPTIFAAAGLTPQSPDEICNPNWTVADWSMGWDDIAGLDFAVYLDNMFQFAHFGLRDIGWEGMEEGSGYTWASLILMDLSSSRFLDYWTQVFSGEGAESISRCLQVAELANARHVLETGESFCTQLSIKERGDEGTAEGLTVRQLALLAGMEEMSIRAAANPKRPNALATISENGRTRIARDVAKRWLESKGRYIPVRNFNSARNDSLRKLAFTSLDDLVQRCRHKAAGIQALNDFEIHIPDERVADFLEDGTNGFSDTAPWGAEQQRQALMDSSFVAALAESLQFPADLLSLRVRELLAKEEVQRVQKALLDLTNAAGGNHA